MGTYTPAQRAAAERAKLPSVRSVEERNALVEANARLVTWAVHRWYPTSDDDDFQDRVGAGMLGLIRAAELWDESQSKFSSYASTWIRQAVQRHIHSTRPIHVPENARLRAIETGEQFPWVAASLDRPVGRGDEDGVTTLGDLLPDDTADADEAAERHELLRDLLGLMGELPELERRVVLARHSGGGRGGILAWDKVVEALGVPHGRARGDRPGGVQETYARAVERLRELARERELV